MLGLTPSPLAAPPDLTARAFVGLDARLQRDVAHPVALALSGGGDSMALLDIAARWARARGRRLLALTVDHGLSPDSAAWSRKAAAAARAAGADWRGLDWHDAKPATGLPAAAREARHRLLAEAARQAGARVILTAHTADDIAESDWMRGQGSTLGRLRDWSPSPAWPEGRGLMLHRPLLGETRAALRDHLRARGLDWIEDPANADPRFARSRARAALSDNTAAPPADRASPSPMPTAPSTDEGVIVLREPSPRMLAAAVVCAGGGDRPPRGDRLTALSKRLADGAPFVATLCGATVMGRDRETTVLRNAGEYTRRPPPPLRLTPGVASVWDGRFEITAQAPGLSVHPALGRLSALSIADRAWLKPLPPRFRSALPVLIRDDGSDPVLAWREAEVRCLVGSRLARALDQTPHEADLSPASDGASPRNDLSSF